MTGTQKLLLGGLVAAAGACTVVAGLLAAWLVWRQAEGQGWRTHTDTMGFSVEAPPRWTVRGDAQSGRVELRGPGGEQALVWPLYAPGVVSADVSAGLALRLAQRAWPAASWGKAEACGPQCVRLRGSAAAERGTGALAFVPSAAGSSGFLYVVRSPAASEPSTRETFARVLSSFRLLGAAASTAPTRRYDAWTDPVERAFSLEAPAGWRAEGGTVRPGLLFVQASFEAVSPDGRRTILLSDNYPAFVEPSGVFAMGGLGPGSTYVDPMGGRYVVAPYVPGIRHAVDSILPQRLGAFRVTRQADRPDVAARLPRPAEQSTYDAGEAEYVFSAAGSERRGYAFCVTERTGRADHAPTMWRVWRLFLAEATPDGFEEARAALSHAAATFAIDPRWAESQAQLTAAQSQVLAEMGQSVSRSIAESWAGGQRTLDAIHERGARARRGVEELVDPVTGRELTVSSGSSYYWVDPRGTILGTETSTQPGIDFRELLRR